MKLIWTATYLGALLSVAGIYDQVMKRIPSQLRTNQVPESRFGIDRADNFGSWGCAYGVDIIFVHGLGSNPDTTWGPWRYGNRDTAAAQMTSNSRGKACWVSDFLPENIPASSRKDIRIFFYNYDSYWRRDTVWTRLWNTGKSLLDRVAMEIRRTEEERTQNLVFVGHSYGSLVIKRALNQASTSQSFADIAKHIRAIFFLGTPHRGSSFSRWGSIIAWALQPLGSNPLLIQEVAYDSEFLLDLHRELVGSSKDKLRVINFFEARKTRLVKCMREQSATYGGANIENIKLPVDHYGLNKFESKNENYGIILQKLLEIVTSIASCCDMPRRRHGAMAMP
ncbi:MAG: hypothetical protein M1840_007453 [Geoglossum simile]|nr:MAG: hypothetical protein M1840_007453 [Geoglossum simile]